MIVYLSKHYSMHLASSHLKVELCQTVFLDDVFDRKKTYTEIYFSLI